MTIATTTTTTTPSTSAQRIGDLLAGDARPSPPGPVKASLVFAWRVLITMRRAPEQMADAVLIPVVFTVLFTYLFGGALTESTSEYLQFLLPGTLVMTVLLVTVYSGLGLNIDINRGVVDRFRTLPIWPLSLIVGRLIGEAGRYLIASILVIALGLAMGFRPDGGVVGVLAAMALVVVFAYSLSWVWTTLGLLLETPQAVTTVSLVVQFPLMFASNTFVDPDTMPGWLQAFVAVNPVSHLVTAVRDLVHGTATLLQPGLVILASALLVAVFAPLSLRLYRRRT